MTRVPLIPIALSVIGCYLITDPMADHLDEQHYSYEKPGFLTKGDREFLFEDDREDSENAEKRRRIRQRTISAFQDFALLFERLSEKDRRMIFEEMAERAENEPTMNELEDTIALVCLGVGETSTIKTERLNSHRIPLFEQLMAEGIMKAYARLGLILEDLDFEVTSWDEESIEHLKAKILHEPDADVNLISASVIQSLAYAGEVDQSKLNEFIREELRE